MKLKATISCFFATFFLLLGISASAQKAEAPESKSDTTKTEQKKKEKTVADMVKKHQVYEGLFTIYQDSTSGKLKMQVTADQLDKEYIHFSYIENGLLDAGFFRGAFRNNIIFKIQKYYDRIEFVQVNTSYYFDPENPLSRAKDANINNPIIASEKILVTSEAKDTFLIDANKIFLSEALTQITRPSRPGANSRNAFQLGKLDSGKSKVKSIKNYPKNTDLVLEYVYNNPSPSNRGSSAASGGRSVVLTVQQSLIEVPENDFEPRMDDPRVGYFTDQVTDQTSTSVTPYRDMVNRWHLVKKNPNAAISDPVEPIVWWIENTTPMELRPLIKEGVERWNIAFEKAGFSNAIVCKTQPDDADWDAGDIRYNVLRWTSSPQPPFGGYGPSFTNPRTGQILGADIMLEYVFVTNRVLYQGVYNNTAGLSLEEMMFNDPNAVDYLDADPHHCAAGHFMQEQLQFGKYTAKAMGLPEVEITEMMEDAVIELVLHEVGHTLGLNHNFRSSQCRSIEEVHNTALTEKEGLGGSVMDYPAINIASDRSQQGEYYITVPGPYDRWAIQFAYQPELTDPVKMEQVLSRSAEPELAFGNDADAMRGAGRGIDPTIMTGDFSSDAISYAIDRIKLVKKLMPELRNKLATEGNSYQAFRNGYNVLMSQYNGALLTMTKYIGGVKIDRAMVGQDGATQPFTPIDFAEQKKAMNALKIYGFAPNALLGSSDVYAYLMRQRRGFSGGNEDPHIHATIESMQKYILAHLIHPNVLKRMTDTRLYGNQYSLSAMMTDLTDAIFSMDLKTQVNSVRQNLQMNYVDGLALILKDNKYDHISKTMALRELKLIKNMMEKNYGKDDATRAHREHVVFKIDQALDED